MHPREQGVDGLLVGDAEPGGDRSGREVDEPWRKPKFGAHLHQPAAPLQLPWRSDYASKGWRPAEAVGPEEEGPAAAFVDPPSLVPVKEDSRVAGQPKAPDAVLTTPCP